MTVEGKMIQPQNIFWAVKCRSRLQLCISRDKGLLSSDLSLICSICELKTQLDECWTSVLPIQEVIQHFCMSEGDGMI